MDEAIGEMGLDGGMLDKYVIVGAKRNVGAIGWLNEARGVKSSDNDGMKPDRAVGEEEPDHGMMIFDDRRLNEVIGSGICENSAGTKPDRAVGEENSDHMMMIFDDRRLDERIGT